MPSLVLAVVVICFGLRLARAIQGIVPDDFARTHFRIDTLLMGVYCRYLWLRRPDLVSALVVRWRMVLPVAVLLLLPAFCCGRAYPAMFVVGYLLLAIAYSLLLLLACGGLLKPVEHTLPAKFLARVGTWSYNIYLWHFMLAGLNLCWFNQINAQVAFWVRYPILQVISHVAILCTYSLVVGYLGTRWVEMPFLVWRDRLFRRPEPATPPSEVGLTEVQSKTIRV